MAIQCLLLSIGSAFPAQSNLTIGRQSLSCIILLNLLQRNPSTICEVLPLCVQSPGGRAFKSEGQEHCDVPRKRKQMIVAKVDRVLIEARVIEECKPVSQTRRVIRVLVGARQRA